MTTLEIPDYHLARLLILIDAFTRDGGRLEGLTKLAKLDFLLRYPVFLERLLVRRSLRWSPGSAPTLAEREAVESRMVRYKYGPWDARYYTLLGALSARGLVDATREGALVTFELTPEGREVARRLANTSEWQTVARRSALLKRSFDRSGNRLKSLIYDELPDAVDRPHWASI